MAASFHRPAFRSLHWAACGGLMASALLFSTGCATTPAPRGGRWVVSTRQAEFYRNGPAQAVSPLEIGSASTSLADAGPDFQLPGGTVVTMVQREFGFSRIVTEDGNTGYVANEQIRPAPALASVAPVGEIRRSKTLRPRSKRAPAAPLREEQLDLSDIPLPLPI